MEVQDRVVVTKENCGSVHYVDMTPSGAFLTMRAIYCNQPGCNVCEPLKREYKKRQREKRAMYETRQLFTFGGGETFSVITIDGSMQSGFSQYMRRNKPMVYMQVDGESGNKVAIVHDSHVASHIMDAYGVGDISLIGSRLELDALLDKMAYRSGDGESRARQFRHVNDALVNEDIEYVQSMCKWKGQTDFATNVPDFMTLWGSLRASAINMDDGLSGMVQELSDLYSANGHTASLLANFTQAMADRERQMVDGLYLYGDAEIVTRKVKVPMQEISYHYGRLFKQTQNVYREHESYTDAVSNAIFKYEMDKLGMVGVINEN